MKLERLNEIEKNLIAGENDPKWVLELISYATDLRKAIEWVKRLENEFYDQVDIVEGMGEIRTLNPQLKVCAYAFKSLFGTVNEALDSQN